jgi:hypothetical protein
MSRKTLFLLAGFYLAASFAFGIFRVVSSPFFAGLTASSLGKSIGGSLLLFGAAGCLPILAWSFQRFDLRYALWPMLSWAFIGIALAYFLEIGIRVERDVQVSTLARNLAQSDAKLSCLDSQRAGKFNGQIGITDREISIYCGCISEIAASTMTTDELTFIATVGTLPPPLHERAAQLGRSCGRLFGRQ